MDILDFGIMKIATFLLVLARVGGIFTTAPIFSNVHVAPHVRVAIALCLAFVFLPMARCEAASLDWLAFALMIAKEAMVGLVMGFLAALIFAAIQMAGAFIDLQLGFGFAQVVDPMNREHNAVLGQFQNLVATLLFLGVNGHHLMLRGLAESFNMLPLGEMAMSPGLAGGMTNMFASIFLAALKIGAPVVGVVFLTDVALGILARTVPQLNVFVVGLPAKLTVGLFATIVVLPVAFMVMGRLFLSLEHDLLILVKQLGGS